MDGALSGIKVLDFSTLLPGPLATLFLADAGAEVVKVENPARGDEMRHYSPRCGEDSGNFHLLNRGKKSVAVDLKSPEGKESLTALLKQADILVEQFRPGVMARLGLGYDDVRAINPAIIYCSITGYGQTGNMRRAAGHDLNYQAMTGLLALSHGPQSAPVVPPALIADVAGGTYPALVNILTALYRRARTGEGAYLDIAMAESLFPFTYWAMADGKFGGAWPGNGDALVTGGTCRYRLYPTADDRLVAAAPIEQAFWERFCEAIGLEPALRDDTVDPDATLAQINALIRSQTAEHWQAVFSEADCCCTVVATLEEALEDPHFAERAVFSRKIALPDGKSESALPLPLATGLRATPSDMPHAPRLGENMSGPAPLSFAKTEEHEG